MATRFHLFGAETRRSASRLLTVFRSKRAAVQAVKDTTAVSTTYAYFHVTRAEWDGGHQGRHPHRRLPQGRTQGAKKMKGGYMGTEGPSDTQGIDKLLKDIEGLSPTDPQRKFIVAAAFRGAVVRAAAGIEKFAVQRVYNDLLLDSTIQAAASMISGPESEAREVARKILSKAVSKVRDGLKA